MTQVVKTLACGLAAFMILSNFQCGKEQEIGFLLRDFDTEWIDNSGKQPQTSTSPLPREAFGIRLNARMTSDGTDDLLDIGLSKGDYWAPLHPINGVQIYAVESFDTVQSGTDISHFFMLRSESPSPLSYTPLQNATSYFNSPPASGFRYDLLMTEPPSQAGTYQFVVKISFVATPLPSNKDTLLTLPPVVLQ